MLELPYIDAMESSIIAHEADLISIVTRLAPKFELPTIPVMHILIIMIALTEILYRADLAIPEPVSVNEAIELAKTFSDDQGRMFINGALSAFLKDKEKMTLSGEEGEFNIFWRRIYFTITKKRYTK
jgi:N utilization substance protein B